MPKKSGGGVLAMYKIVICDDDKNFITYMKEMILQGGLSQREIEFFDVLSGEECINVVQHMVSCDLLILDMQMEGMDGHATARCFRKNFPDSLLVFCSGVLQPTDESFKTTPFRYLKKSYDDKRMLCELKVILERMMELKKIPHIIGKNHNNVVKLRPNDILYIDNYKRGSEIHIHENSKDYSFENRITTKKKLPELYEELKDFDFEYAHNSYIVNLNYVVKMKSEGVLKLCNGCELNVSRSRLPDFRKALSRVMGEKYT